MEIEKLDYEPGYKLNITATITDQAIKFENRCMGEALSLWQIKKEDVLARIQEADKLKAENEKLRAELDEKEKYYEQMIDALAATDSAELEQVKRTLAMMWFSYVNKDEEFPHSFELEALEKAESILGPWAEYMPKYLRREQE
jgi:regulator of replication initiation timing